MTGPEHYREAESLLRLARGEHRRREAANLLATAQVHATLAVAAAADLALDDLEAATEAPR